MTKYNPDSTYLFPDFHIKTLTRKRRSAQQIHRENQERLMRGSFHQLKRMLEGFLPGSLLQTNEHGAHSRERFYSKANTFLAFLGQVLSEDGSCQDVVHRLREQAQAQGCARLPSASTAAYTKARSRLSSEELSHAFYEGAGAVELEAERVFGRPLIAVDGTTLSMPDTKRCQEEWPQSSEQAKGIGFPLLKMVGAFSVDTGVLLDREVGNKHDHELTLLRKMNETFQKEDILAMDRAYCSYYDLALYTSKGVDVVVRNHQARKEISESDAVQVVAKKDRWIQWEKPMKRPNHVSKEQWAEIPEAMNVRQITYGVEQAGFRSSRVVLITTLSEEAYSAEEVAEMYRARWLAEVSFRDLKRTIDTHTLRCKSPEMIQKELWVNLIAYNALCFLQKKAAEKVGLAKSRFSFKGCLQVLRAWEHRFRDWKASSKRLRSELYEHMAAKLLEIRPNRVEPRVNKKRPKKIRYMMKPRRILQAELLANLPGQTPFKTPLS